MSLLNSKKKKFQEEASVNKVDYSVMQRYVIIFFPQICNFYIFYVIAELDSFVMKFWVIKFFQIITKLCGLLFNCISVQKNDSSGQKLHKHKICICKQKLHIDSFFNKNSNVP